MGLIKMISKKRKFHFFLSMKQLSRKLKLTVAVFGKVRIAMPSGKQRRLQVKGACVRNGTLTGSATDAAIPSWRQPQRLRCLET